MAGSTTTINACDASVWLDNASGTATDISGSSNEFTMTLPRVEGNTRVFGSKWPIRKVCGKDCTIDLTVVYSTAADEGLDLLRDWYYATDGSSEEARTVAVYLPDKNVGSDYYSGEFLLTNLSIPATAGEGAPIMVSATLMVTGAQTHSTAAT